MNISSPFRFVAALTALLRIASSSQAGPLPVAETAAPKGYAPLLAAYVVPGGVRYAAWKKNSGDMDALKRVVDFYSETLPPKDRNASLAWHINAYNAWILHNILAKYPTTGPLAGDPRFFHRNGIVISGTETSFDHLEQNTIRPVFKEPRVHFALNCASASCPPLPLRPLEAATLNDHLDQLARTFTNANPQAIQVNDDGVSLSQIFNWYKDDFV